MIKLFIMDVDGTLTDGKIYVGNKGELMKAFNVKDGYAIHELLPKHEITPVILTGRKSKIVEKRAEELDIKEVFQDVKAKDEIIIQLAKKYGCQKNQIVYIGDDENDLIAMKMCGIVGCPSNACDSVKKIANFISVREGGNGAVREFVEWLIKNEYCY